MELDMQIQWFMMTALLITSGLLTGCAGRLHSYPPMSDADSLATIAARQATVTSLSAECDIELTDAEGQNITLDGVLVAAPPGRLRLRAWKLGHAVFDLTASGGKTWVMVPEDGPTAGKFDTQRMPAGKVSGAFDLLGPEFYRNAVALEGDEATIRVRGAGPGWEGIACDIERRTLTAQRFAIGREADSGPSEVVLDRFVSVNGVAWPMRMKLRSSSGEVLVRVRQLELNGEIPAGVFTPPARAKELP